MTEEIPPNFDKPWSESNVILLTQNAGDKKLYANKSVLSVFSPVMRAMFSARWSNPGLNLDETRNESVPVAVDYEAMKEILRIVFQVDGEILLKGPKVYDSLTLIKLYKATDYLDFAHIRKLCIKQMLEKPSIDMAVAAMNLDLHDTLISILEKLDGKAVWEFLGRFPSFSSDRPFFSKKDVAFVYKKIVGRDLPKGTPLPPSGVLNLEEIAPEIKDPRIDLTKKWFASDVAILTKNSADRVLYSNKGTLASVTEHFRKMFFNDKMWPKENADFRARNQEPDDSVIHLDVEYATMKTILSIIHHCNQNYNRLSYTEYHPALLYDMLGVASKDQLQMRCIWNFCYDNLCEQFSQHSLDVAFKMGLPVAQEFLIKHIDWKTLVNWIRSDEKSLVYRNGVKEVVLSSKQTDPVLSFNNLRDAYNNFCSIPKT